VVIPVADRHLEYARRVRESLEAEGLRVEVDEERDTVNMKIRRAQLHKVPFALVVGDREMEAETVSVRDRSGHDVRGVPLREFLERARRMVEERWTRTEWSA